METGLDRDVGEDVRLILGNGIQRRKIQRRNIHK